jgi:adenylate kinase family enzyme
MKRVAVFGNAEGGKSTLAKLLAEMTGLPLHPLDLIQYRPGGGSVPHAQYLRAHAELLRRDEWIIDGFGCVASAWERFARADTLVYVDLPLMTTIGGSRSALSKACSSPRKAGRRTVRSGPARSTATRCFGVAIAD